MKSVNIKDLKNGDIFIDVSNGRKSNCIWMACVHGHSTPDKTYHYVVLWSSYGTVIEGIVNEWKEGELEHNHEVIVLFNCVDAIKRTVDHVKKTS